jgi:hypothetical protein
MNQSKKITVGLVIACALVLSASICEARDLVSSATTAANTLKTVAQILGVTGVIGGGAIMQLPGAGDFGRRVMVSGLVGCLCAFGAPAFMSLMRTVFGNT